MDLSDTRVTGRRDHDLLDIVVLSLCAVMSGAEGWDDIEARGEAPPTGVANAVSVSPKLARFARRLNR